MKFLKSEKRPRETPMLMSKVREMRLRSSMGKSMIKEVRILRGFYQKSKKKTWI